MEKCSNRERMIGNLETPYVWKTKIVCAECHKRLTDSNSNTDVSRSPHSKFDPSFDEVATELEQQAKNEPLTDAELRQEQVLRMGGSYYNRGKPDAHDIPVAALGLTSRKQAEFVTWVGILLAPVGLGILLVVWGMLADQQMKQQLIARGVDLSRKSWLGVLILFLIVVVLLSILVVVANS